MKQTKRINVTISIQLDTILERWCSMTGASKSKVVAMMLQSSLPALDELMDKVENGEGLSDLTQAIIALADAEKK